MNEQLVKLEAQPLDVARQDPSVADMLHAVIKGGVTSENVGALEKMLGLYERMEDRKAEQSFIAAYVAMQAEMQAVQATKPVHAKDGTIKFMVAPPEEIDAQARPIYQKHGFALSYKEGPSQPGKVCKICILQHVGGHKTEHPYSCRVGSGPPGATESQADGSAHSYAKRGAMCDALNIIIKHPGLDDARDEGAPITAAQATELEHRVSMTNSDKAAFLKVAGAASYAEIPSGKYDTLDALLRKKEARGR